MCTAKLSLLRHHYPLGDELPIGQTTGFGVVKGAIAHCDPGDRPFLRSVILL
jgi:hypothetical protein